MTQKTRCSVPNGVVFIEDIKGAMPPDPFTDEKIQWTSACIAVVCMHEDFGQTELTLGPVAEVAPGYESSFEGAIETPSGKIAIVDVPGNRILEAEVFGRTTAITIWRNHPKWPDQVIIGWG